MSATPTDGATPLDPDESEGLIPTHVTTREQLNRVMPRSSAAKCRPSRWMKRCAGRTKLFNKQ